MGIKFKKSFLYFLYLSLINDTGRIYDYLLDFWPEFFKLVPGEMKYFFLNFGLWMENDDVAPMQRMHMYIQEHSGMQDGFRILDIGSGYGGQNLLCCDNYKPAEIQGIEINQQHVDHCNKQVKELGLDNIIRYMAGDAMKLPESIQENYFDRVMALHCLMHFKKRSAFLDEAYRVLKPGGKLVIFDQYLKRMPENDLEQKILKYDVKYFANPEPTYTEAQMREELTGSGFKDIEIDELSGKIYPPFYDFLVEHEKEIEQIRRKFHYPKFFKKICYKGAEYMKLGVNSGMIGFNMVQATK